MNDGGRESGRVHEQPNTQRKSSGEDFAQAIAKISVAQICESQGFQSFQHSALEILSDIAVRYVCNIGRNAHFNANFSGRTHCNAFDIVHALEDLGSIQGFSGASDIDNCLASSGTIKEIVRYVDEAEQIPFAYSLPQFPIVKERKLTPSFLQKGEEPPGEHIPAWLPAYPDIGTYIKSPTRNERVTEHNNVKIEQEILQKRTGQSSKSLHQRLVSNELEESPLCSGDAAKAKHARESNPFLAAPLRFGEQEVSSIVYPAKLPHDPTSENPVTKNCIANTHVSVLETFAPAIESIKSKLGDSEENLSLNRRSVVQFKIGARKKSLGPVMDLRTVNKAIEKTYSWFGSEYEKDDKRRRAEKIQNDSMENSQELAQL